MFDFGQANNVQKEAIKQTEGPVLIIAGPGTGKTFTLVKRAVYLISEKNVKPEEIMITTFTEKAAKELITRISDELLKLNLQVNINDLYIGTLHSICLRLLKENIEFTRLKKNYRLLDEFDQKYLIYNNYFDKFSKIENLDAAIGISSQNAWGFATAFSYYANVLSEELAAERLETWQGDVAIKDEYIKPLAEGYRVYQELLAEENAMDFASIQVLAYKLLQENEPIRTKVQQQIKYVMIDEYQDTNYVQEQLIFLIGANHHNICVVGDDDQGLYRFRGATIRNILEFPLKFPDCAQFNLVDNYRSESGIVDFYNKWMNDTEFAGFEWGKYRFNKAIRAVKENQVKDMPTVIKVFGNADIEDWGDKVIEFLEELRKAGTITDYNQVAFLFRSVKNERVKALADYLEKNHVPVYAPRSDMFFEREEIKLMIGALLAAFPLFLKSFNQEYTPKEIVSYYTDCCLQAFLTYKKDNPQAPLIKWVQTKGIKHSDPNASFDYAFTGLVYEMLQFEPFLTIMQSDISGVIDSRAIRNLAAFTKLTAHYEYLHKISVFTSRGLNYDVRQFFFRYLRFLFDGGIAEYEDEKEYAPSGCVSFMTIHQSKGMEFPVVIVGSLFATPRKDGRDTLHILEEQVFNRKPFEPTEFVKYFDFWRVYYTAFSRAQNLLVLTAYEHGKGNGREPSKYFEHCLEGIPDFWDTDIDFGKIKCEKIKDVNIKESYSFTSHIAVYENCSLQYKFFKDLGFVPVRQGATIFGTLVHTTIEDIHKAAIRGETDSITEENVRAWFGENYETISKREHVYLAQNVRDAALKQVLRYVDGRNNRWANIRDAEVEVSHVEPDYILSGKVDLIQGENDTLEIVDFKAERKPDMIRDRDKIQRYKRQLQIYAYIIEQRTGIPVSKLHLYYTGETDSGIPTITFRNEPARVDETIQEFTDVVHKIQCRNYSTKSTSQTLCNGCDLRHFCQKN